MRIILKYKTTLACGRKAVELTKARLGAAEGGRTLMKVPASAALLAQTAEKDREILQAMGY